MSIFPKSAESGCGMWVPPSPSFFSQFASQNDLSANEFNLLPCSPGMDTSHSSLTLTVRIPLTAVGGIGSKPEKIHRRHRRHRRTAHRGGTSVGQSWTEVAGRLSLCLLRLLTAVPR